MPTGIVRVTPGSEPANVRVVPNSPNERAKAKLAPAAMEGDNAGSKIFHVIAHGDMPTPAAEAITSRSICRSAESTDATTNGNPTNT